jgi:hypothetical protein
VDRAVPCSMLNQAANPQLPNIARGAADPPPLIIGFCMLDGVGLRL